MARAAKRIPNRPTVTRRKSEATGPTTPNGNNHLQTWLLRLSLGIAALAVVYVLFGQREHPRGGDDSALKLSEIPVDGERAFGWLQRVCSLGSRVSGSAGMQKQQQMLADHFQQLGGAVEEQRWKVRHPLDGSAVEMVNLIVRWHPDRNDRVLLCAHYDTRPYPDRDPNPRRRRDVFVGANDGGSGVAVLAELGHHMANIANVGVDFVLFDGEELIYDDRRDKYFIGSEYFARDYATNPPPHRYRYAVLLDMVGDASLQIFQERNSVTWRDSAPLVYDIWRVARQLGVREFIPKTRHEIRDDHLPLHNIARIPSCDIIDFDYPRPGARGSYWHTTMDTPDKCSPLSLAKVGWVVLEWLKQLK